MADRTPPLLLALPLLAALAAPAHPQTDPAPPVLRLPDGARPTGAEVELALDPARAEFDGRIRLALELDRPMRVLWLNADQLEIGEATLETGGRRLAARVLPAEQFAGFAFSEEAPAGPATLTVRYRGRLDEVETEGLFRQKVGERWFAFSQFESTFARRAFPCFDEPSFRLPWRLTLRVPRELAAYSNTPIVSETPHDDGTKSVEFARTPSVSSYLVALGVGPFARVDGGSAGRVPTPVGIVVPQGQEARAKFAAEVTGPLLAELEEYFDIPHPFAKLDNLLIPHTVGFGAMENPGLITYAEQLIAIDPERPPLERLQRYSSVAAHENAHQWFGNLVTMAWWDDIWLNEGFADWISDKIVARWRPDWWTPADRVVRRSRAVDADRLPSARKVRRPIGSLDDVYTAFDGISYAKGATLLEMFEAWMGPDRFRRGIQRYLRQHAWGNATSDDFLAALSAEGAPEVAGAFRSFLDQAGAPVVSFALACPASGPARLSFAQRRYVPLGSAASEDQTWSIPVRFRYGAGERVEAARTLLTAGRDAIDLPFCPEWVSGNDEGIGYYLAEYSPDLLARLAAHARALPESEQIALLDDLDFLLESGDVQVGDVLALLPPFAGSPHRRVVESVADFAGSLDKTLVPEPLRGNYERYLAALFGARVRELGLAPKPGEPEDDALLRPQLVELLAVAGGDATLRREARVLAERWLADHGAVAPDMVPTVLGVAARDGDAALFDRYLAAAEPETDRRVRGALFRALGDFRDPALVERALALVISGRFDVRETAPILQTLSADRLTRQRVYDWVRENYDRLAAAMPQRFTAYLAYTGSGLCDAARRGEVDSYFRPRLAGLPGGAQTLEEALDILDVCAARKTALGPGVAAYLKER